LPNPFFDWCPVIIEAIDDAFAPDLLHPDVQKARVVEQRLQPPWVSKRPIYRNDIALLGCKKAIYRIG
jgi:hypothetical protein